MTTSNVSLNLHTFISFYYVQNRQNEQSSRYVILVRNSEGEICSCGWKYVWMDKNMFSYIEAY